MKEDYSEPLTDRKLSYDNLLIKSVKGEEVQSGVKITDKYPNIIGDEHNPISEHSPVYSHQVQRYTKQPDSRVIIPTDIVNVVGIQVDTNCLSEQCTPLPKFPGFDHIYCRYWMNDYNKFSGISKNYFDKVSKGIMKLAWPYISDELTTFHYLINSQFSLAENNKFIRNLAVSDQKIRSAYETSISTKIKPGLIHQLYHQNTLKVLH